MIHAMSYEAVQTNTLALTELWQNIENGNEILVIRESVPFAYIQPVRSPAKKQFHFGMAKGVIGTLPQDFDTTPDDFKEYLQ